MKIFSKLILALLISGLILPVNLWATPYYVRTDGNNSNTGLSDTPGGAWATPSKAAATMICGDTTQVHAGTYTESTEVRFSKTTDCGGNKITLKNFPGETPHLTWDSAALAAGTARIAVRASNPNTTATPDVWVEGLDIGPAWHCVKSEGSLRFTFTKNTCHDTSHSGILGSTNGGNYGMTIDGNTFLTIGGTNQDHCLYVTGQQYLITNNLFIECAGYGVQMDGAADTTAGMVSTAYGTFQGLIANNVLAYNVGAAAFVAWTGFGTGITTGPVHDTIIENNLILEESQTAGSAQVISFVSCSICDGIVTKNIWFATGNVAGTFSSGTTPAGFSLTGNLNSNPLFINAPATIPATPDFHLTGSSPAFGYGANLSSSFTTDINGTTRPAVGPWTAGVYEAATIIPPTPLNLHLTFRRSY